MASAAVGTSSVASATAPSDQRPGTAVPAQRVPHRTSPTSPTRVRPALLLLESDHSTRQAILRGLTTLGVPEPVTLTKPGDVRALLERRGPFDVALVSLRFGAESVAAIRALRQAGVGRVLALSLATDTRPVIEALAAGATGIVANRHSGPGLRSTTGKFRELSEREVEVIRMVADGRSNKWIAAQLDLSALTVKSHLARIGRKLGTGDRAHMVALALRAGVIG